jgi:hypothetical protein
MVRTPPTVSLTHFVPPIVIIPKVGRESSPCVPCRPHIPRGSRTCSLRGSFLCPGCPLTSSSPPAGRTCGAELPQTKNWDCAKLRQSYTCAPACACEDENYVKAQIVAIQNTIDEIDKVNPGSMGCKATDEDFKCGGWKQKSSSSSSDLSATSLTGIVAALVSLIAARLN